MEPVHTTVPTRCDATMHARSTSLVHRLLAGCGRASLVAYDLAPVVEAAALCHGLSEAGELMVACLPDEEVPVTVWGHLPLRVRLEVVKEAPEWSVRITACAVHLLGTLEWLDDDVRASYLGDSGLPQGLVELASAPGGRLGVVRTDRVLLHDATGVTAVPFDEVAERHVLDLPDRGRAFPGPDEEWAARELVGRLSPADVADLLAAVPDWDAAVTLSTREQGGCPHVDGQVYCVDVDRTGLTLMEVESGRTSVVMFAFDEEAESIEELTDRLGQLLEESAAVSGLRS